MKLSNPALLKNKHFINGQWVDSENHYDVTDPANKFWKLGEKTCANDGHTLLLVSSQLDESNLISQHAAHCLYSCFLHIQYILTQSHQTLIYFATQFDRLTPSTLST